MVILNQINSDLTFAERERLNQNWTTIERYLTRLQLQLNIISGDTDVQQVIEQINDIVTRGNATLTELENALANANTIIANANTAANNANTAAQDALNSIASIQNIVDDFGSKGQYQATVSYNRNNIVYNDGSSYIYTSNTPSSGNAPPTYPTLSNDYWSLLADRGANGSGAVSTVNGKSPNSSGAITLVPLDIGAATSAGLTAAQEQINNHANSTRQWIGASTTQAQTILSGVETDLNWDNFFNVNGADWVSIIDNKLVLQTGVYVFFAQTQFISNANGRRSFSVAGLRKDTMPDSNYDTTVSNAYILNVETPNYFLPCQVFQDSGSSLNLISGYSVIRILRVGDFG